MAEETVVKPKPMVEVGGKPLLWHIMNIYSAAGFTDFVVALGYKGQVIKEYFLNYYALNNHLTVDLKTGRIETHGSHHMDWRVTLVDTGEHTQTGGRIKRLQPWIGDETFMMTYGDGVANIDVSQLLAFHKSHKKIVTVTAVRPPSRFGGLVFDGDSNQIDEFREKPQTGEGWINGGFFVFNSSIFDYIPGDATPLESEPLERVADEGQLMAFKHTGFWQPMDTIREKHLLESLWASGNAPWKIWE